MPWPAIVIGVVILALLTVGGIVAWQQLRPAEVTEAPTGPATKASDAVAGYLHALAEGDLETALAYGQSEPTDRTFISREVVERSREIAPIGNIAVTEEDSPDAFEVEATYTIGDQPVEARFGVIHDGEKWLLLDTTANLSVADLRQRNLPIRVNGVPVGNANELLVLPGAYAFDTGLTRIGYGTDNVTTVSAPGSRQGARDLTPELTEAGREDLVAAARTSLDECLTRTEMDPTGCPFGAAVPEGSTAESVSWKLIGDPFAEAQPTLEWTDRGEARMPVQVKLLLTATIRTGSSTGRIEQEITNNSTAVADILGDPLTVGWRS